jgi:hypothetical protein
VTLAVPNASRTELQVEAGLLHCGQEPRRRAVFDLKKVWQGEIGLKLTFWAWGVLIATILLGWALGLLVDATENQFLMFLHDVFALAVGIFVAVAIWRSAGNYKGSALWMVLARLAGVANVLALGLWAFGVFEPSS